MNLNQILRSSKDSVNAIFDKKKINYLENYDPSLPMIYGNTDQLFQLFINLLKNSIESINEKFTKKPNFTKKIDIEIDVKDDYIEICITDNGTGFEDKDLTKILKPYFTTKKSGRWYGSYS